MRAPQRFSMAYPSPSASAAIRRLSSGQSRPRAQHLISRGWAAGSDLGERDLSCLLDEEFDEFLFEPALLIQLANQA